MRTIDRDIVGAFVISKDNKVLLGQSIKGGVYQDQWIVPGGGIDEGESEVDAIIREIMEEVGLDIGNARIEAVEGTSTGQSEKILRETQEKVLVNMIFHDFVVYLPKASDEVILHFQDDLAKADWFTSDQAQQAKLGPATRATLQKIQFI